jgi:hypothetical protein
MESSIDSTKRSLDSVSILGWSFCSTLVLVADSSADSTEQASGKSSAFASIDISLKIVESTIGK